MILGLERSAGDGNSYPLQYSYLENSMDKQVTVHGVAKIGTQLSGFHSLILYRYQQRVYLEMAECCNSGHSVCGEPLASLKRQRESLLLLSVRRNMGVGGRMCWSFLGCRWWAACFWVRGKFLLGSVSCCE